MATKNVVAIIGPTGIGKTTLAIKLAKYFKTEIFSADSRQFFKEMSIGTAVPSKEELKAVPHHFIQHKSIFEDYSVGDFEKESIFFLERFFEEKDLVIMVGGSGLYLDAVTKGLDEFPEIDPEIRAGLNKKLKTEGIKSLQDQLAKLDREHYSKLDLENPHRLIRALEVCIGTGKPYSSFLGKRKTDRPFNVITVGIMADREIIYDRIEQRVDLMIQKGLVQEAKALKGHSALNALQTVGYRELFNYFNGEWTLDFAVSEIKKNTRRFAKRQLTWFKRNKNTLWIDYDAEIDVIIRQIEKRLKKETSG